MTNINSGKAWSELDIRDLQDALRRGYAIEDIATFLCRDADEVRAKVAELEPRMTAVSAEIFAAGGGARQPSITLILTATATHIRSGWMIGRSCCGWNAPESSHFATIESVSGLSE